MKLNKNQITNSILEKLTQNENFIKEQWNSKNPNFNTRFFICDNLLDENFIKEYINHLPNKEVLLLKSSIRERKHVGVDYMNYDPIIGDVLMAFHDKNIIHQIEKMTGLENLEADPSLYASGISIMEKDDFLNPHLDNSHDGDQEKYRIINLLYYVTPDWSQENGGNLELWDTKVSMPFEIHAKFNRLVVMETNDISFHSVNKVKFDGRRVCISNYYFSKDSSNKKTFKHITTFSGRPEEPFKKVALTLVDKFILNTIAKFFPNLIKNNKHRIKKG